MAFILFTLLYTSKADAICFFQSIQIIAKVNVKEWNVANTCYNWNERFSFAVR